MKDQIWLIGAGTMAIEYAKVLKDLVDGFEVIGRGENSAQVFEEKTGLKVCCGGLSKQIQSGAVVPEFAIIATGVDCLAENAMELMDFGVKNILVEKPGGLSAQEIEQVYKKSLQTGTEIFVAYNRRFYSSVIEAKKIIEEDGGATSFQFDFTEWSHEIEKLNKPLEVFENWLLSNSSHVVDLAFYLGGIPGKISCSINGSLPWHSKGSVFCGSGQTVSGALFSYHANWESAGRWGVEVNTLRRKLIFRPLEKLQQQMRGTVKIDFVDIDDHLDIQYKPGLYLQMKAFLHKQFDLLMPLKEQLDIMPIYDQMVGSK